MGLIENLLKQDAESKARLQTAVIAVRTLTPAERKTFLVELITVVQAEEADGARVVRLPAGIEPDASFVTKCQAVLADRPEGVTVADIALAIGQTVDAASSTVRWLRKKFPGHVIQRGNRWHLLRPIEHKKQLREYIREVLAEASPLSSGDIIRGVRARKPDAAPGSIKSELIRMQGAKVLFTSPGISRRSGRLYSLTPPQEGGAQQT